MPEPTTPNTGLIIPNTGDLVGTWGSTALNPDFVALDGMLGGSLTIPLSSSNVILGLPPPTLSPTAGPVQSQNALIVFNGTITTNIVVQLGMPGRYIFHNQCTPITNYVQITSVGAGTAVGLPPGQKVTLFHDGTNVDFVDTMPVGAPLDLHGARGIPAWMTACSIPPYLVKDGSIYAMSQFPVLGAMLGSQFGGDGVSTFGVPDERARMRVAWDNTGTGRLTGANGVTGTVMGSAGGSQATTISQFQLPAGINLNPNQSTVFSNQGNVVQGTPINQVQGGGSGVYGLQGIPPPTTSQISINMPTYSLGGSGGGVPTVQPTIISFLALIKT